MSGIEKLASVIEFCGPATKFQLKVTILVFWAKFPGGGYFGSGEKHWAASLGSGYSNGCRDSFLMLPNFLGS